MADDLQLQSLKVLKRARTECFMQSAISGEVIPSQLTPLQPYHGPQPTLHHHVSQEALLAAEKKWQEATSRYEMSCALRAMEQRQLDSLVFIMYLFKGTLFRVRASLPFRMFHTDFGYSKAVILA
jgi:hypothetical protein